MKSQRTLKQEAHSFAHNYTANRRDALTLVSDIASAFSKESIGAALGRTLTTRDMDELSQGRSLSPAHMRLLFANI